MLVQGYSCGQGQEGTVLVPCSLRIEMACNLTNGQKSVAEVVSTVVLMVSRQTSGKVRVLLSRPESSFLKCCTENGLQEM